MTSIVKGKRYRVSYECVAVQDTEPYSGYLGPTFPVDNRENHTFEEIVSPKEPFKVGDLARHTGSGSIYLLLDNGQCALVKEAIEGSHKNPGHVYDDFPPSFFDRGNYEHVSVEEL